MESKTVLTNTAKIIFPILLGGVILYWMYRGEDFGRIRHVLTDEMNWTWMLLSFPFGILAQLFRGWRWKQALEPIDEHPRTSTSIYAVFLSYAVSLIIPRIGEFTRCGVLKRWEGISFSKAGAIAFTVGSLKISLSGLAVGALFGILLNAILPGKDFVFSETAPTIKDADRFGGVKDK